MSKKSRPSEGGGNWMDTYGDLVTLLLCFFVMLYSMSTLDTKKWEIFVRSIGAQYAAQQPTEVAVNSALGDTTEELTGSVEIPEIEDQTLELDPETLYLTLAQKLEEMGAEGVSVSRGEDYTFIVFQDSPFFDGESSVLTRQGKDILDVFCQVLDGAQQVVGQINIMGHTAQGNPDRPNRVRTDRMLSSMRAAEVCIYVQEKEIIEPEKLVCLSYGQHRPVAPFDTAENRALNRRVEILLLDNDADLESMNADYTDYKESIHTEQSGQAEESGESTSETVAGDGFEVTDTTPEDVATQMAPISAQDSQSAIGDVAPVSEAPAGEAADTGNTAEASAQSVTP